MATEKKHIEGCKIFISHAWDYHVTYATAPMTSPYFRLKAMLNRAKEFDWQDISITKENPVPGPYRVRNVEEEIHKRLSACDVYIISETGVYSGSRLWFQREFDIALTQLKSPKPILIVKPRATRFWAGSYASGADAWAIWNQKSIIEGIRSIADLTPSRRQELLAKGKECSFCQNGMPAIELNRLKGVYCLNCGQVTYLLSGEKPDQIWPDRYRIFWPNEKLNNDWRASAAYRRLKKRANA